MPEAIYVNQTAGTPVTVTGSDQTLITGNIKSTLYNDIRIVSSVTITIDGTNATTNNTLKLKVGTVTKLSIVFKCPAEIRTFTVPLEWVGDASAGGAVSITVIGAGVDTHTSCTANYLYVTSIQ